MYYPKRIYSVHEFIPHKQEFLQRILRKKNEEPKYRIFSITGIGDSGTTQHSLYIKRSKNGIFEIVSGLDFPKGTIWSPIELNDDQKNILLELWKCEEDRRKLKHRTTQICLPILC